MKQLEAGSSEILTKVLYMPSCTQRNKAFPMVEFSTAEWKKMLKFRRTTETRNVLECQCQTNSLSINSLE